MRYKNTMKTLVLDQPQRVARFVAERIGVLDLETFGSYQCIGQEQDGVLIAGAVFVEYNGRNCFTHLAGDGKRWLNREFLRVGFRYPFNQLGCSRISGWVEADNEAARRLNEHFGFRVEATLREAGRNGQDVLIMVMFRNECRWLR